MTSSNFGCIPVPLVASHQPEQPTDHPPQPSTLDATHDRCSPSTRPGRCPGSGRRRQLPCEDGHGIECPPCLVIATTPHSLTASRECSEYSALRRMTSAPWHNGRTRKTCAESKGRPLKFESGRRSARNRSLSTCSVPVFVQLACSHVHSRLVCSTSQWSASVQSRKTSIVIAGRPRAAYVHARP